MRFLVGEKNIYNKMLFFYWGLYLKKCKLVSYLKNCRKQNYFCTLLYEGYELYKFKLCNELHIKS